MRVIVVGGGWAGVAAGIAAAKAGAEVLILERSDSLLGTGLVGGIMDNNGRFTAARELAFMGGGDLFEAVTEATRHSEIEFPGHKHASLYDVFKIEGAVRKRLEKTGVNVRLHCRVKDVMMNGKKITAVIDQNNSYYQGEVFIEATGSAGAQGNCTQYGNGCVMCIYRCPTFGPRISLAEKAGVQEIKLKSADGKLGAMSGSCKLHKDSLSPKLKIELEKKGVIILPLPVSLREEEKLTFKVCQQYASKEFAENIILLDTGHAKMMAPFFPLEVLRRVPGLEQVSYADPYAGGKGNSIRFLSVSPRNDCLNTKGVENLFCCGEKASLVGHTEAIISGTLAGHNAVLYVLRKQLLKLPRELACGDIIAFSGEQLIAQEGLKNKLTFSGSLYFQRMKEKGLYTTDLTEIEARVEKAGLKGIFHLRFP